MAEPSGTLRALRLGMIYCSIVFCAGFLLGVLRTLWLAPWIGEQAAELIEFPVMLVVMVIAARWIVRHSADRIPSLLIAGGTAALGVLMFDVLVGLGLRDMSFEEILFDRDPLTGTIYYLMIGLLALLPAGLSRFRGRMD